LKLRIDAGHVETDDGVGHMDVSRETLVELAPPDVPRETSCGRPLDRAGAAARALAGRFGDARDAVRSQKPVCSDTLMD